ncbi:hypothetical protein HWV62_44067, partial [Athelia sp. TMB]
MAAASSVQRRGRRPQHFLQHGSTNRPSADISLYPSQDGNRVIVDAASPPRKKHRVGPDSLDDELANWTPGIDEQTMVGDSGEDHHPVNTGVVANMVSVQAEKRAHYFSSDFPMAMWKRDHISEFLQEFLRRDGLGTHRQKPICVTCNKPIPDPSDDTPTDSTADAPADDSSSDTSDNDSAKPTCPFLTRVFPFIEQRYVESLKLHATTNRFSKEWTGQFWRKRTLCSIGLVVQLGHAYNHCRAPDNPLEMTIIDSHGIHTIAIRFCGCELALAANKCLQLLRAGWYPATMTNPQTCATIAVLEEYHLLHLKGALNVHDFIGAVSRRTDAACIATPPEREKSMGHMFRQYSFLKRLKRSGRGHDPAGVGATAQGGCAVLCWACPHEGINIPSNWRDVDKKYKFLYMLILAMDANFRLVNRIIANEHDDPELGPGWACTVNPGPYKEHLKGYVSEKDITTCIAFAALLQKDSKVTTGLRTSGVGTCMCARHEVFRPRGVGDLQKGERYANMDYVFFSSIVGITLLITISYDIVCQWKINLNARMAKLPPELRQDAPDLPPFPERVGTGIPVWHAAAHEDKCRVSHSLRQIPGVGHTGGEGIERGWLHMNQHASSMKEMGQGNRHDTLDDVISHHNWERNISQGDTLSRWLIIAKEEHNVQIAAFNDVRRATQPEHARAWVEQVTEWEENRNTDYQSPNPYELPAEGMATEAQVRLELQQQEMEEARAGQSVNHVATATGFLSLGLHIEGLQRQIAVDATGTNTLTTNQKSVLQECRLHWRKLRQFHDTQLIYMPDAHALVITEGDVHEASGLPQPLAEDVKLWLPSDLSDAQHRSGCDGRLPKMELKLRVAQCEEALNTIRSNLHAKQHLIHRRNKNVTGQKKSTRVRTLLDRIGDRNTTQFKKYTRAREALLQLGGLEEHAHCFQVLLKEHITLDAEELAPDHEASRLMNRAGGGGPRSQKKKKPSESTKVLSWIWVGGDTPDSGGMHDSVRREYLKARARKHRWIEEVVLLIEEMRRVLCYLSWRADWWRTRQVSWDGVAPDISDGLRVYALRQAALCDALAADLKAKWAETEVKAISNAVAAGEVLEELEGTIVVWQKPTTGGGRSPTRARSPSERSSPLPSPSSRGPVSDQDDSQDASPDEADKEEPSLLRRMDIEPTRDRHRGENYPRSLTTRTLHSNWFGSPFETKTQVKKLFKAANKDEYALRYVDYLNTIHQLSAERSDGIKYLLARWGRFIQRNRVRRDRAKERVNLPTRPANTRHRRLPGRSRRQPEITEPIDASLASRISGECPTASTSGTRSGNDVDHDVPMTELHSDVELVTASVIAVPPPPIAEPILEGDQVLTADSWETAISRLSPSGRQCDLEGWDALQSLAPIMEPDGNMARREVFISAAATVWAMGDMVTTLRAMIPSPRGDRAAEP